MLSCGSQAQPRATLPASRSQSTAATSCAKEGDQPCEEPYSTEPGMSVLRKSPNQRSPSQRMPSYGSRRHVSADRTCGATQPVASDKRASTFLSMFRATASASEFAYCANKLAILAYD